jgi:hypothetical protein
LLHHVPPLRSAGRQLIEPAPEIKQHFR